MNRQGATVKAVHSMNRSQMTLMVTRYSGLRINSPYLSSLSASVLPYFQRIKGRLPFFHTFQSAKQKLLHR